MRVGHASPSSSPRWRPAFRPRTQHRLRCGPTRGKAVAGSRLYRPSGREVGLGGVPRLSGEGRRGPALQPGGLCASDKMAAAERRAPRAERLASAPLRSMVWASPIGGGCATCRWPPPANHRDGAAPRGRPLPVSGHPRRAPVGRTKA